MKERNMSLKLNLLYLIFFAAYACYYPFLTPFFQGKGMSYTQVGILLSLNSIISILFQPLWGYVTDKKLNKKKTLIILLMSSGIFSMTFLLVGNFYTIALAVILFMIFFSAGSPVLDAYCYDIIDNTKKLQYGKIRLMGSIGYAVAALVFGMIIKSLGNNIIFFIYLFLVVICVLLIKTIDYEGAKGFNKISVKDFGYILKNRNYRIFILAVMLLNIAIGANNSYASVLIESTGGNISNLGMLWFVIAMSELPVFFFGNKILKKLGTLKSFYLCIALFSLRFFLSSLARNYSMVIAVQAMQSITYPIYLMATLQYINENAQASMKTSYITIYSALGGGLGGLIGNIFGGMLLENISIFTLYKILSIIVLLALLIAFLLSGNKDRRTLSESKG